MVRLEDLLDQVVLKTLKPSAMVEALTKRGPVGAEQHARELRFLASAVSVGAISANVEKAMANHLRSIQARPAASPPGVVFEGPAATSVAVPARPPAVVFEGPATTPAAVPDGPAAPAPPHRPDRAPPRDEAAPPPPVPVVQAPPPLAPYVPPAEAAPIAAPAATAPAPDAAAPPARARKPKAPAASGGARMRRGGAWLLLIVAALGAGALVGPYLAQQVYRSHRLQTASALRHGSYTSLDEAAAALDRLHAADRDSFLHAPDGPVAHYLRQATRSALGAAPDLAEYRRAIDLLEAAGARFYGNAPPLALTELMRQLQVRFAQAKLNHLGDLHKRAADHQELPSTDTQSSVGEILVALKDAGGDDSGAQALAQLDGLGRDFDRRLFNAHAPDLAGLRRARDLLVHLYGATDPRIRVRLADFALREQQFAAMAAAEADDQARSGARAQTLADFVAEAHTEPLESGDLERILGHKQKAEQAGVPPRDLEPVSRSIAERLAKQLAAAPPAGRDATDAALKRVIAGLRLCPEAPDLEHLRTQYESHLDAAVSPKERADAALAELQAAASTSHADAAWIAVYDARIDEVQRAVPGGLAGQPALKATAVARLLRAGTDAAQGGDDALVQAVQIELRRVAPDDPANAALARALEEAHDKARAGGLGAAQDLVADFVARPGLTGDARAGLDAAVQRLLADGSEHAKGLLAQLALTLAAQAGAHIDSCQFDAAEEYLRLLRRLPGSAATAAALDQRGGQARSDATREQARLERLATLDEIVTAVEATRSAQALGALAEFQARAPGTPEVQQAVTAVAAGLDALAQHSLLGNRSDSRTQLQGALNLVHQALALQSTPQRLALQAKIENLLAVAEARQRATHGAPAPASSADAQRLQGLLDSTRQLNPDKVEGLQRAIVQMAPGAAHAPPPAGARS